MAQATRALTRAEIDLIWTIDRAEVIDAIYYLRGGVLVLEPEHYNMTGWPPGQSEVCGPILRDCFDHGGWVQGVFDGAKLCAVAVLESQLIGRDGDQLELKFLHVDRAYRGQGWGKTLFSAAQQEARRRGAKWLYVSATPSEHTINFYLRQGCTVTPEPDPALLALEPDDIHLVCPLSG